MVSTPSAVMRMLHQTVHLAHGEERAVPEGLVLDLLVNLYSGRN